MDAKYKTLASLGYEGELQDMELAWLVTTLTAAGTTLETAWADYLRRMGYGRGHVSEMQQRWLGDLGYPGSLEAQLEAFWVDGAPAPLPPTLPWAFEYRPRRSGAHW